MVFDYSLLYSTCQEIKEFGEMNFYERYYLACKKENMNACSDKMAERLGISKSSISQWKRRNIIPNGETIAEIARVLNVSCDYLLGVNRTESKYETLINMLDEKDRIKLEGVLQGMLLNEKYHPEK